MEKKSTKKNSKQNIRFLFLGTLIPLLLVTLLSEIAIGLVSLHLTKRYSQERVSNVISELNTEIKDHMLPTMVNLDDFVVFAAGTQNPAILESLTIALGKKISSYVVSMYYATEDFHTGSDSGYYIGNDGWNPPEDWVPRERDWFKNGLAHKGEFAFEDAYVDAMTGDLCVTVSKSVEDESGKTVGVAAVDLLLSNLSKLIESFSVSPNGSLFMIGQNGIYLTNKDVGKVASANYFDDASLPNSTDYYLDGSRKSFIYKGKFYAIYKIDNTPWFIVAEGPVSDFTGGFWRMIFVFGAVLIFLSIVFSLLNIHTIIRTRSSERNLGKALLVETQNLSVASKENAATAQDQSAAVKEIVATMEDNTTLSENISQKIQDVSSTAAKTKGDVTEGVSYIEENVQQLQKIASTNRDTISGIKALGEKIENIWDIVTLINTVADQAKIIAFNAELEASSAGEAGRNFHIVAAEIRRLADGIIDGTKEIKERISEIQQSSDSLIILSENGTEMIQNGVEKAMNLNERFVSIKYASNLTASSAEEITAIIHQQTMASEQILVTLRQIASGVESFTAATSHISSTSQNLKEIALELSDSKDKGSKE